MGDRGNIFVRESADEGETRGVYLYSHLGGEGLPLALKRALQRKQRWDDGPYLTRIIFDEMTKSQHGEETGFGISATLGDNEHPIVTVTPGQGVSWVKDGLFAATFERFIEMSDDEILASYH